MALVASGRLNERVSQRTRHQRGHGEGTPRQDDARVQARSLAELVKIAGRLGVAPPAAR